MEAICDPDNIATALRAVVRNKGAPGIDGITVKQLPGVLKARWPEIEGQLLQGRYRPQPVRRVKIPKPDGGTRNLGIPTVIDRVIQQAVLQRLQPRWDPTFSEHSYGFRPGRSAQQAVAQAQADVIAGHRFVVDLDLAKFFDRVNHGRLMAAVAARVADRREGRHREMSLYPDLQGPSVPGDSFSKRGLIFSSYASDIRKEGY
jgi:RNA-directed DNA polymerase